ncbi:MAG: hypothetical protein EOO96_05475 [Pedobacter sp.]|nr:MAG: hypothetical protein EOO96_05475 [Pedobacter sp.]
MTKIKLSHINFLSVAILGFLLILNIAVRYISKEQDKIFWDAEIYSSTKNSSAQKANVIKIIEVVLHNTFNQSTKNLNFEPLGQTSSIVSESNQKHIVFDTWKAELLPDSIHLKYFSIDERRFYLLSTKLPYEKLRKLTKKSGLNPTLSFEMLPAGKSVLRLITTKNENQKSISVETFTAKETVGDIEMLIYEDRLGEKYKPYDNIESIIDFSDLLQNQYKWIFKAEIDPANVLKEVSALFYSQENVNFLANTRDSLPIPSRFDIKWGNQQEYGTQYYFNPIKILNAFRQLQKIESLEPIIISFRLFNEKVPQCEISRGGKIIKLNNLYPEKPIKYAR